LCCDASLCVCASDPLNKAKPKINTSSHASRCDNIPFVGHTIIDHLRTVRLQLF
jgi:hypothetical protein